MIGLLKRNLALGLDLIGEVRMLSCCILANRPSHGKLSYWHFCSTSLVLRWSHRLRPNAVLLKLYVSYEVSAIAYDQRSFCKRA